MTAWLPRNKQTSGIFDEWRREKHDRVAVRDCRFDEAAAPWPHANSVLPLMIGSRPSGVQKGS